MYMYICMYMFFIYMYRIASEDIGKPLQAMYFINIVNGSRYRFVSCDSRHLQSLGMNLGGDSLVKFQ